MTDKLAFDLKTAVGDANLEEVLVGNLYLPTGKIVASDPFFTTDYLPFKTQVTPGTYPVKVLIHRVEEDHTRVAFAKIQFSDAPATSWSLALTEDITDEQVASLEQGEFYGYGVDAGLGCFVDQESNEIYVAEMDKFHQANPEKNYYDKLAGEFKAASGEHPLSRDHGDWNTHYPVEGQKHNITIFASGWGDGSYPTYWGTDAKGNIVELITHFGVVGIVE